MKLDKLYNQLEEFQDVRYRMGAEGFHYCFESYSSFEEIKDEKFHELREKYIEIAKELEKYVISKINSIQDEIDNIEHE
jgi:thymidylate kinase